MNLSYTPGTAFRSTPITPGPTMAPCACRPGTTRSSTCTTGNVNGMGGAALYTAQIQGGIVTTCPIRINQVDPDQDRQQHRPHLAGRRQPLPGAGGAERDRQLLRHAHGAQPACQLVLLPVVVDAATGGNNWPTTAAATSASSASLVGDQGLRQRRQDRRRGLRRPGADRPQRRRPAVPAYTPQLTG